MIIGVNILLQKSTRMTAIDPVEFQLFNNVDAFFVGSMICPEQSIPIDFLFPKQAELRQAGKIR